MFIREKFQGEFYVSSLLHSAWRPVVIVGGGCRATPSAQQIAHRSTV